MLRASSFLWVIFGLAGKFGATTPGSGVGDSRAFAIEVLLTAGLVNTILATASGARNVGPNAALAVGGYIALAGLRAGPVSDASMNPTGLAVIMATGRSPLETYMQLGGGGQRLAAAKLRDGMEASVTLRRALLNYGHAFYVQTAHTALANGRSKLEDRLSRWLLMAHDRIDGDALTLTHELLAIMLGVRRPGVTIALNLLEARGFIRTHRGVISIVDRKGLEENANGANGAPEAEFQRLFG